jgi:hypothetical protein
MSQAANGKFNYRAFVSVLAGFTFLAMAVTGLVMFFAPSCRIARDTSWTVGGYSKEQWTAVHVWFSIAFVIAAAFHVYLNWAALTNYFKTRLHQGFAFRPEWVSALVICAVIGIGTVYEVAPFSSLTAWKEAFKRGEGGSAAGGQGWRGGRASLQEGQNYFASPPSSTASSCETSEKSSGGQGACDSRGQSQNATQQQGQGGTCTETQMQRPAAGPAGYGIGQKTLTQFCTEQGIELPWAISRLQSKGFIATQTMTMREIADSAGVHPRELRSLLQAQ